MLVLAAILMSLATLAFVLSPLVRHLRAPLTDGPDLLARLRDLHALKSVTYETLQDVELDYHAGKISEPDYRDMTDRYTREAIRLVQRIEEIEAQLPAPPGRRAGA
ncbi:MAG TPA: hypothetical protein VKF61_06225 [Candidatus Polarisedimenticolia bacterium]|nr:hypothetical protein [Candidatus Polarisedimenticolia bacterium]